MASLHTLAHQPPGHQPSHLTRPHHPPLAGSTSAKVACSPLPSAKPMKRVDTVELDFITCTTTIPPRAWGTGEYTPPPAKAVSMVFGVHGGHVATCQSGSRLCVDYPLICCCCLSHLHGLQGPAACAGLSNDRTRSPTRHPRRKGRPTRPLIDFHGPIAPSSSGPTYQTGVA
jgi:hypothetical protein